MSTRYPIILRGEHISNIIYYLNGEKLKWNENRGYSAAFAQKHDEIISQIINDPERIVKVVSGFDDICNYGGCPKKGTACIGEENIQKDCFVASKYNIDINEQYKSKELMKLLRRTKVKELGVVKLITGEEMTLKMIEPPQDDYLEAICHFLEHKRFSNYRGIKQRLEGKYISSCIDRFFIGEINNMVVGHLWYGYGKKTRIGNFGHVYTEPSFRKKGISKELLKVFLDDFNKSDCKIVICSAHGMPAQIYLKYGFKFVKEGELEGGGMALIKKQVAGSFKEFDDQCYKKGLNVKVREGDAGDRHDCDRMLYYSQNKLKTKYNWNSVFITAQIPFFIDALFCVEDGGGFVTVLENSQGNIVGFAYVLSFGSENENDLKVMDFTIHPNYFEKIVYFIEETMKIAKEKHIKDVYAFVSTNNIEKSNGFLSAGFIEEYSFQGKFRLDGNKYDMKILKYSIENVLV